MDQYMGCLSEVKLARVQLFIKAMLLIVITESVQSVCN